MSTKSLIELYRKHILVMYRTKYVSTPVLNISCGQGLDTLATSLHTESSNPNKTIQAQRLYLLIEDNMVLRKVNTNKFRNHMFCLQIKVSKP